MAIVRKLIFFEEISIIIKINDFLSIHLIYYDD
jgi:hypothetical protein